MKLDLAIESNHPQQNIIYPNFEKITLFLQLNQISTHMRFLQERDFYETECGCFIFLFNKLWQETRTRHTVECVRFCGLTADLETKSHLCILS